MAKKIPMRKCLGCDEMFPQRELVRVVKTKIKGESEDEVTYEISLYLVGKKAGRGAYICKRKECFETAKKKKKFSRALGCEIPEEVFSGMLGELEKNE